VKNAALTQQIAASGSVFNADSEYVTYTVQDGDTIWDIVKKFVSVSTSEVLTLNNISDP
jgi:LysM repeat protein